MHFPLYHGSLVSLTLRALAGGGLHGKKYAQELAGDVMRMIKRVENNELLYQVQHHERIDSIHEDRLRFSYSGLICRGPGLYHNSPGI